MSNGKGILNVPQLENEIENLAPTWTDEDILNVVVAILENSEYIKLVREKQKEKKK